MSSIIVLSLLYDSYNSSNNVLLSQPSSQISKVIQTAAAISGSNYYYFQSSSRDTAATITNIQLPGIISNNKSSSPIFPNTYPATSQSLYPPPPPIIHNTRAPAALNGKMLPEPVLQVPVATEGERGLLGIAITKHDNGGPTYVFLYYTESGGRKTGDNAPNSTTYTNNSGIAPAGNRLYRYNLDERDSNNIKLTNPLLLLNLPASPPPEREGTEKNHNGGKVLIGPDNNVYVGIGDVG